MMPVLAVAMDGSEAAAAAARWAGRFAEATGDTVRLLHVRPPLDHGPGVSRSRRVDVELDAVETMEHLAEELTTSHAGLHVAVVVEEGDVAEHLRRAADRAATLVMGTRGAGRAAVVLGSVALGVATRAESPVVLVPPGVAEAATDRDVLVGVDLDGDCGAVLTYGFEQAQRLGVRVHALNVWRAPSTLAIAAHGGAGTRMLNVDERVLSTELAALQTFFPEVEAVSEELCGSPAALLPAATEKAALLVLGRHRRYRIPAALGPLVPSVMGEAACPVAVVPHW